MSHPVLLLEKKFAKTKNTHRKIKFFYAPLKKVKLASSNNNKIYILLEHI